MEVVMRLKVKRVLKGGEHFVSFENVGFSREETKRMKKSSIPIIDFSPEGLGIHRLDKIYLSIKCGSAEEANRMTDHIKQRIKEKLMELSIQADKPAFGRMVKIYMGRIALVFGILCVLAVLTLSAYRGVISSTQFAKLGKRLCAAVQDKEEKSLDKVKASMLKDNKSSQPAQITYNPSESKEGGVSNTSAKGQLGKTTTASIGWMKPDFTITVVPETLVRYSDWGSRAEGSIDKESSEHFKLILTGSGGFEGPVNLEVSGSCFMLDRHLIPQQIKTLPGSSTLLISLAPKCPHQVCSTLTVIARGITSSGDLITHQKRLVLAIRQRPFHPGTVWHISPNGNDLLGDGGEKAPFRTVQMGIDCAQAGDTVLMEKGLYQENINLIDKENIFVTSRFIYDQDESTIKSTIIESRQKGWVATIGRSDQITLCGFTIRKGRGNDGSGGGGIYCYSSNPNILDNIISKNKNQSGYGAGIYCYDSEPHILRNQITHNYNYNGHGAGIYCYHSNPDIQKNELSENYSSGGGSAIHLLEPSSVKIMRNLIYSDSGSSAILLYNSGASGDFQIVNNTISCNRGDAIRFFGGPWFFKNNIIAHNNGYGLFTFDGTAHLAYNDVWGNVAGNICSKDTTNYFGLAENLMKKDGNISKDPRFGNPAQGNFHLSFNSPCIDLGDPNDVTPEAVSRIDMGAIEYSHPDIVCGDVNRDGFIDFGDIDYLYRYLFRRGSPPDPFKIGDINCDGKIDQHDLGYLYSFLYYYGPEPCASCK
jgi:hypothetical protein